MVNPRRGKVVAIDAGAGSRRVNGREPARSPRSVTHDPSDEWFDVVDKLAGFVWSHANAGPVNERVTDEVFKLAWLRLADHFADIPTHAVDVWLQQTVVRERARMAALRTGHLRRVIASSAANPTLAGA